MIAKGEKHGNPADSSWSELEGSRGPSLEFFILHSHVVENGPTRRVEIRKPGEWWKRQKSLKTGREDTGRGREFC